MLVVAAACAQTRTYTPRPAPVRIQLRGLQANRTRIEVNDLRAERAADDSLSTILARQVAEALGRDDTTHVEQEHRLLLDVVEHRSYFTLGHWNATTKAVLGRL